MGKIFYNLTAIPIPNDTYVDKSDGRVLCKMHNKDGRVIRRTIGVTATKDTMYPNEFFQQRYPDLWGKYYQSKGYKEYELSIGLYSLTLGLVHKKGLYQMLHDLYGESSVNYILDYVMFSMLGRSDTTQLYPERMRKEVLFSEKTYSDSWYSRFFLEEMPEKLNHQFRMQWLQLCKEKGITEAWICIDGSNNDCEVEKSALCEQGFAKSHSHSDIVGYMYAVNAADGRPITYYVYEGSKPDSSAFHQIAMLLARAGIKTRGFILDLGFCTDEVIQTLRDCSFEYVIMMHANHLGHTSMIEEKGESIKWEPLYSVSDDGVFGISGKRKLFRTHAREGWVNLYYDGIRGSHESVALNGKIRAEKRRIDSQLAKGHSPSVATAFTKYIEIADTDGRKEVRFKYDNWRKDSHGKGFFSITSSSDMGAEEVLGVYRLRDASETAYSLFKSQEGFHTTRVHSSPSILAKFAVGFIVSIVRTEIEIACKALGLDANVVIGKLDHVHIFLASGNEYVFSRSVREDIRKVLFVFGINEKHLDALTTEVNYRLDTNYKNRYRSIPSVRGLTQKFDFKKTSSIPENQESTENASADSAGTQGAGVSPVETTKKRGRRKGSKDSRPRKRRTKAEILAEKSGHQKG